MSDKQFRGVVEIRLDGVDKFGVDYPFLDVFGVFLELVRKDFGEAVGLCVSFAVDVVLTGFYADFHRADARAVLPAVVLFFHEQKQLVESVNRVVVFVFIVF